MGWKYLHNSILITIILSSTHWLASQLINFILMRVGTGKQGKRTFIVKIIYESTIICANTVLNMILIKTNFFQIQTTAALTIFFICVKPGPFLCKQAMHLRFFFLICVKTGPVFTQMPFALLAFFLRHLRKNVPPKSLERSLYNIYLKLRGFKVHGVLCGPINSVLGGVGVQDFNHQCNFRLRIFFVL